MGINKLNLMYALLVIVDTCFGFIIYSSCSADEDYDCYSSKDELFTLANRGMGRGVEIDTVTLYYSPMRNKTFHFKFPIPSDSDPDTIYWNYDMSFQLHTRWFEEFRLEPPADSNYDFDIIMALLLKTGTINDNYTFSYHFWIRRKILGQTLEGESDIVYDTIPKSRFVKFHYQ